MISFTNQSIKYSRVKTNYLNSWHQNSSKGEINLCLGKYFDKFLGMDQEREEVKEKRKRSKVIQQEPGAQVDEIS